MSCFLDIICIGEHQFACCVGETVERPGILAFPDCGQKLLISGHGVAQTQARCGEKLGDAPENDEIFTCIQKSCGRDAHVLRRKFGVSLVDHDEDSPVPAPGEYSAHVFGLDGGGGGIVGVADNDKRGFFSKCPAEVFRFQPKAVLLFQGIVTDRSAGQPDLPLIFGVGGRDNQRFPWF